MKYTLKSARAIQAEFYSAIPSMGSPGLHLQQLTLVTSSPGHIKHSGFPLAAHQALQLCPSSVCRHCPAEVGTVALLGMG